MKSYSLLWIIIPLSIILSIVACFMCVSMSRRKGTVSLHQKSPNVSNGPIMIPLHTDSNGILLAYVTYNGSNILVCIDSGSDYMVLANRDCSGCDMDMGSLVSPSRFSQGKDGYDILHYGTQQDNVKFEKIPISFKGYPIDGDNSKQMKSVVYNLRSAITMDRSGSSNYNIMGIGKSDSENSLYRQLPYDYYMIMLSDTTGGLLMYNDGDSVHGSLEDSMIYVPSFSNTMYSVSPLSVRIGMQQYTGYKLIIDTGSNMLTLPSELFNSYGQMKNKGVVIHLTGDLALNLKDHHLNLNGQSLVDHNTIENYSDKIIIGSLYFKNMAIAFERNRIGFSSLSQLPKSISNFV